MFESHRFWDKDRWIIADKKGKGMSDEVRLVIYIEATTGIWCVHLRQTVHAIIAFPTIPLSV